MRTPLILATAAVLGLALPVQAQDGESAAGNPTEQAWDGLVRVKGSRLDAVYLLPGADFQGYTKVLLEPTEVAFRRNWQRDHSSFDARVSDSQARRILEEAGSSFDAIIRKAFEDAGFVIATEPGADVVRVRTAVINLDIVAPDVSTSARTRTFSREAGEATLVVEARDSLSREILGRAIDTDTAGDFGSYIRNSVTNRADFERLFREWARRCANGLVELREQSPVGADGQVAS